MTTTYYVKNKKFKPKDTRLGRHVRHDSRSLNYQVKAEDVSTLSSVRHERHIPILDQGRLGSCTGNAATACMGTGLFWDTIAASGILSQISADADERYALTVYSDATLIDTFEGVYPPIDTGSDGLSVAKVLQNRSLISGYLHATSLEAVLTALSKQPVIAGTDWRSEMFEPEPDGRIRIGGTLEGGHEYLLSELDVENQRIWMDNSWTEGWGIKGRAYFTWDDFEMLLKSDGDVTAFVPLFLPSPTPAPIPVIEDPKVKFLQAAHDWDTKERKGANRVFQQELREFLEWYS